MMAELKYFFMISPTLPRKLKKSRAIRIKWCWTEPYALARSNQITCTSVLSLLAESIEFHIICECTRHPGKPSEQMYLYNDCSSETLSYGEQEFSPLHLVGILGENLWYLFTAFPLVSKYHQPDTILVVRYPSSKPVERGQWVFWGRVGSFDIACTISHLCPGHYLDEILVFLQFYPAIIKHYRWILRFW